MTIKERRAAELENKPKRIDIYLHKLQYVDRSQIIRQ